MAFKLRPLDQDQASIEGSDTKSDWIITARGLNASYKNGETTALNDVHLSVYRGEVLAVVGGSGSGKSTFARTINRMNDDIPGYSDSGKLYFRPTPDDQEYIDLLDRQKHDDQFVRQQIGMVAQQPSAFAHLTIFDNIAQPVSINGFANRGTEEMHEIVTLALQHAGLWEEVKDRLHEKPQSLSGGQNQRLCIARALALRAKVLLLDESYSALDEIKTVEVEQTIKGLVGSTENSVEAVVMVTHDPQQARRADSIAYFTKGGQLVEVGPAQKVFEEPKDSRTRDLLHGAEISGDPVKSSIIRPHQSI